MLLHRKRIRLYCDELNTLVPFCKSYTDKVTTLQWTTAFLSYIQQTYGDAFKEVSLRRWLHHPATELFETQNPGPVRPSAQRINNAVCFIRPLLLREFKSNSPFFYCVKSNQLYYFNCGGLSSEIYSQAKNRGSKVKQSTALC